MILLPCIYCRETGVPRTREHVLQDALGANAVLENEVCGKCNNAFSGNDKYFVDAVNWWHLGKPSVASLGIGELRSGASGQAFAVRIGVDRVPSVFPQFSMTDNGTWQFLGPDESQFEAMLGELRVPGTARIKARVVADENVSRCRVIRSGPGSFLVEGRDASAVQEMASDLRERGLIPAWRTPSSEVNHGPTPEVRFNIAVDLNKLCRAMAKVALNYVCYRFGVEMALHPGLDRIRLFARYDEGECFDFVVPTLLNSSLANSCAAFASKDHHIVQYVSPGSASGRRSIFIAVQGTTIGRVDLTRGDPPLPLEGWIRGTRFDHVKHTVEDYSLPDDIIRAVINPAALGLQDLWPLLRIS
jgi:hypothetical protein